MTAVCIDCGENFDRDDDEARCPTRLALADLCNERGGLNVNGNRRFDRDRFLARTDAVKRDRIVRSPREGSK